VAVTVRGATGVAPPILVLLGAALVLTTAYETWAPIATMTALVLISVNALIVLTAHEPDRRVRLLLVAALFLKVLSGVLRYGVNALLYDGGGDSNAYWVFAARLSSSWSQGEWIGSGRRFPGTGFVDTLSAVVHSLNGPSFVGGFIVFSWIGFWGLYLCFRAFQIAVPSGDHFRYGLLVLLLPSLLFWPSAIGKDAWMIFSIGAFAYGFARYLAGSRVGLLVVAFAATAAGFVRPHVSLILLLSLTIALIVGRGRRGFMAGRAVALVVVSVGGYLALNQVQAFFGLSSGEALTTALEQTAAQTSQGGSEFDGASIRNPATLPWGVFTVLFRPLPYEAENLQGLAASLEGLVLLSLLSILLLSPRRPPWRRLLDPYLAFALSYTLLFAVAFSSFNNFGLLTRQRVQVFPFFLVFLALTASRSPHRLSPFPSTTGSNGHA
jgi:hypothetical protein